MSKLQVTIDYKKILLIGALLMGWFLLGWKLREMVGPDDLKPVRQALSIIQQKYDGPLPEAKLEHLAIRGALYSIGDIRANFYSPQMAAKLKAFRNGNYGVIGVWGEMDTQMLLVTRVKSGSSAAKAGIVKGDRIMAVDGWKPYKDSTFSEVAMRIIGKPGTLVGLTLVRGGIRQDIKVKREYEAPVAARLIDVGVDNKFLLYIQQTSFSINSVPFIKNALTRRLSPKPQGVVWDLRDNSGGDLQTAVQTINYFLADGVVVYACFRGKPEMVYRAVKPKAFLPEYCPLVVLVNGDTMSAAEISAAAIQENHRGILIGEKTYGKGTINSTYPLSDGALLELTDGHWLSPTRHSYHQTGVEPDMVIRDDEASSQDEILEAAIQYFRGQNIKKPIVK